MLDVYIQEHQVNLEFLLFMTCRIEITWQFVGICFDTFTKLWKWNTNSKQQWNMHYPPFGWTTRFPPGCYNNLESLLFPWHPSITFLQNCSLDSDDGIGDKTIYYQPNLFSTKVCKVTSTCRIFLVMYRNKTMLYMTHPNIHRR